MKTVPILRNCHSASLSILLLIAVVTTLPAHLLTIDNDSGLYDTGGKALRTRSSRLYTFDKKQYGYGCDEAMTGKAGNWSSRAIAAGPTPAGPYTKQFKRLVHGIKSGEIPVFGDCGRKASMMTTVLSLAAPVKRVSGVSG